MEHAVWWFVVMQVGIDVLFAVALAMEYGVLKELTRVVYELGQIGRKA